MRFGLADRVMDRRADLSGNLSSLGQNTAEFRSPEVYVHHIIDETHLEGQCSIGRTLTEADGDLAVRGGLRMVERFQ
jgi:hypothetical protein